MHESTQQRRIVNQQQKALQCSERELMKARKLISEVADVLDTDGVILAQQKLRNYLRGINGQVTK